MKCLPCFSPHPAAPKPTRLALLLFLSSGLLFAAFGAKLPAQSGSNTAYVGFTGGTGEETAIQQIFNWTFTNP